MPLSTDRVRAHTAAAVLQRIDDDTSASLLQRADASPDTIATRLAELDREWDTDRAIELEASLMGLAGLALGTFVRPTFRAVPAVVAGAVLLHAVTGVYPLLPVFRRLGLRTAREIARERYALKALRGDFAGMADGVADPAGTASHAADGQLEEAVGDSASGGASHIVSAA
jgi:hypothetical protein